MEQWKIEDHFRVATARNPNVRLVVEWFPGMPLATIRPDYLGAPIGLGIQCPNYKAALSRLRETYLDVTFIKRVRPLALEIDNLTN